MDTVICYHLRFQSTYTNVVNHVLSTYDRIILLAYTTSITNGTWSQDSKVQCGDRVVYKALLSQVPSGIAS